MLQRVVAPNGVVYYQSILLQAAGVRHAFSTRLGGVSAGPFATLNLGNPSGVEPQDDPANLAENHRRLAAALQAESMLRAWVKQVHSTRVELLEWEGETEYAETLDAAIGDRFQGQIEADALLTDVPNVLLSVRVADCVPILLASRDGRWVAAVHAGWRGLAAGILPKTLRALGESGVLARDVVAAIGPAISAEHFEVGPEVAAAFTQAGLENAITYPQGPAAKPHVNLPGAAELQLRSAGVTDLDTAPLCTFRNAAEFYSHRRDRGITGRLAALIGRGGG